MNVLKYIPFFSYLLIAYNILAFAGNQQSALNLIIFTSTLISGAVISLSVENILIMIGIFCLYFDILKSTRNSSASIIGHVLSMLVFVIFLIEYITVKPLGTASFLILTIMSMTDVIAGFTVSISAARRDITVER
ncbi:MAG: hypothetical protein BWK80_44360 [Desulfobacteraceae bacterium IS3]|nr:MAG: hypothetical protein BWK80_44360 [Desulfobacteraceae bacterium IS3]HAO19806.1 hypothetical protein [Desulfobacteraceae bacterium]